MTPGDNRVLECAVAAASGFVVTGGNNLLRLGASQGIGFLLATGPRRRRHGLRPGSDVVTMTT